MRRLNKSELLEDVENVKFSKIVAYNTIAYKKRDNDNIYIRFYDTDIVVSHSDYVVLSSGGHKTVTTKNRINEFQVICTIHEIGGRWFVRTTKGTILFFDGMKISSDGVFIN